MTNRKRARVVFELSHKTEYLPECVTYAVSTWPVGWWWLYLVFAEQEWLIAVQLGTRRLHRSVTDLHFCSCSTAGECFVIFAVGTTERRTSATRDSPGSDCKFWFLIAGALTELFPSHWWRILNFGQLIFDVWNNESFLQQLVEKELE